MKSLLRIAFGLIVDDWWLAAGIVASVAIVFGAIRVGVGTAAAGWLLLALILATLVLSLRMEYRRKRQSSRDSD